MERGFGVYSYEGGPPINMAHTFTFDIKFSGEPIIDQCTQYQTQDCELTEIDPTDEDGEAALLTVGRTYRFQVRGGPWNDGTNDRFDVAISTDGGDTWGALAAFMLQDNVECIQNDEENMATPYVYFTATSEDFAVRVNDEAGEFADNTGSISFSLCDAILVDPGCEDQFQLGDLLGEYTVPADDPSVELGEMLNVGDWYVIETSGTWRDGGEGGPESNKMEALGPDGWEMLDAWSQSNCSTTDGGGTTRYYFQAFVPYLTMRVHDVGGVFPGNWGQMYVKLYGAEFYRFQESCETTYDIGNMFKDGNVSSQAANGLEILNRNEYGDIPVGGSSSPEDRWFVVDTLGGPWTNSGSSSYAAQIQNINIAWTDFDEWAYCAVPTDLIGHWRIFVPAYGAAFHDPMWYRYRVDDDGLVFGNNSGILGYRLLSAYRMGRNDPVNPPQPNVCTAQGYGMLNEHEDAAFAGTDEDGIYLPNVQTNYMYAVETVNGPWSNNGIASYAVDISDDNGATWSNIWQHPAVLCSQQADDADHVIVWINVRAGHYWKVRARDAGGNYADNSGSMGVRVSPAFYGENPWNSCAENYVLTEYILSAPANTIYAYQPTGAEVPYLGNLIVGSMVAVEITDAAHWQPDGGMDSWLAQITFDGGATWYDFEDAPQGVCVVTLDSVTGRKRIYFSNTGRASEVRLRVDYDGADWDTNHGSLVFKLFRAPAAPPTPPTPPYPEPPVPPVPPPFVNVCSSGCLRPSGVMSFYPVNLPFVAQLTAPILNVFNAVVTFLGGAPQTPQVPSTFSLPVPDVGGWVEYARCSALQYIAWCPVHLEIIKGYGNLMRDVEPIATTMDIVDLMDYAYAEYQSYDWTSTGGGTEEQPVRAESIIGDIIANTQEEGGGGADAMQGAINQVSNMFLPQPDSIWAGAPLTLTMKPDPAGMTNCAFRDLFSVSSNLGATFCLIQNIMVSKFGVILLFMFDILIIFQFIFGWLPKMPKKLRRALAPFENSTISY